MEAAVMVAGSAAQATAWWLVSSRRLDVWRVMPPTLATIGIVAVAVRPPAWSTDVGAPAAAAVGIASGVVLYLATRAFVSVARPWRAFRAHSVAAYGEGGAVPLPTALALSILLSAPGEELFWRGLLQPVVVDALERGARWGPEAVGGAALAWATYVLANLPSRNLAIAASAVVGGAAWAALAWWSGGVLAPLLSHAGWTALMLSFPVIRSHEVRA